MTAILRGSVGREGTNIPADVRTIQTFLNQRGGAHLTVDGRCGQKTIAAILEFQRTVVRMARPDGRVDPQGLTLRTLATSGNTARIATIRVSSVGRANIGLLTESDFSQAAAVLSCEVAVIKAVTEVESKGSGYFADGRPKILFEAHWFSKFTNRIYDTDYPDISSRRWNKSLYVGGVAEYSRLEKAMALNSTAALKSASWGRFQIMGFNHAMVGYANVERAVSNSKCNT